MSGHSKWHSIKHKKGALDARRGKLFTKLIKEITIAARSGGSGDPNQNPRLRKAVFDAKAANMPNDTIDRAIKRGTGELEGTHYEEVTYEGYGPGGVAIMVQTTTDNRNRTVSDLRHAFTKAGGNMAELGAVGWQFERIAYFSFPTSMMNFDKAFELGIEAGANDVVEDNDTIEITAPVESFKVIADALHKAKVQPEEAGLRMSPKQEIELNAEDAVQVLKALESIEDLDDVQNVYSNLKVSDEALAALETA